MIHKPASVIKYLLFIFNLIFVISSIVLMVIGLIIQAEYHRYRNFLDSNFFSAPTMLICLSLVMVVVTFFGCCGAIQENYCMIMMFSITMGVLFMLELLGGFTGLALSGRTRTVLSTNLNETMQLYNKSRELTKVWDSLQERLECCGVHKYTDWYPVLNNSLPMSCCSPQTGAIAIEECNEGSQSLHRTTCLAVLTDKIRENSFTIGAVGIGIALAQVLGILFSCSLARAVRNHYEMF